MWSWLNSSSSTTSQDSLIESASSSSLAKKVEACNDQKSEPVIWEEIEDFYFEETYTNDRFFVWVYQKSNVWLIHNGVVYSFLHEGDYVRETLNQLSEQEQNWSLKQSSIGSFRLFCDEDITFELTLTNKPQAKQIINAFLIHKTNADKLTIDLP